MDHDLTLTGTPLGEFFQFVFNYFSIYHLLNSLSVMRNIFRVSYLESFRNNLLRELFDWTFGVEGQLSTQLHSSQVAILVIIKIYEPIFFFASPPSPSLFFAH